jgi:hypothetical protein
MDAIVYVGEIEFMNAMITSHMIIKPSTWAIASIDEV